MTTPKFETFGTRLFRARLLRDLTTADVKRKTSISLQRQKNYEMDKTLPTYGTLLDYAHTLDVSLDYLCGRSDEPKRLSGRSGEIGPRLKEARLARGLTQDQLAEAMHSDRARISMWERGGYSPSYWTLLEAAAKLKVSVDWLCGFDTEEVCPA